jgi:hypothetical protein
MVVAGVYAGAMFSWWIAPLPILAALIPMDREDIDRYWNRVRMVLGLAMLAETAFVYFGGLS